MMSIIALKPSTVTRIAASAIRHSVTNIMMRQPINCAPELIMEGRLLDSVCWRVLTSLVTRLRMSPWAVVLKYCMGTRLIFRDRSSRSCLDSPSVMVAMM